MKKIEKMIFVLLVNIVLTFSSSVSKKMKNSYTLEEKPPKKKNVTDIKLNDPKIFDIFDPSLNKEDVRSLEESGICNETATGKGCESCEDNNNDTCSKCMSKFYLSPSDNKTCDVCPNFCCNCTDSTHCVECYNNYFLNGGQCKKCSNGCKSCDNSTICLECYYGFYKKEDKCIRCPKGCDICVDSTNCTECNSKGYYKGEGEIEGQYIKCSKNC